MKVVLRITTHNLFKNMRRNLTILLNMILCTFVIFILLQNYHFLRKRHSEFFSSGKTASNYEVAFAVDEDVITYANDKLNLTHMFLVGQKVIEDIENNSNLFVYSFAGNSTRLSGIQNKVDLSPFIEETMVFDESSISNPVLSLNAFEAYHLKISSGRFFTEEDYNLESGQPLPVILGYELSSVFQLGDIIEYKDNEYSDQAVVVGFLEQNSGYVIWNAYYPLDRAILSPFEFPRMFDHSNEYRRIQFIYTKSDDVDVQAVVNNATAKNGFYTLEVSPVDGVQVTETKTISEKNVRIIGFLAVISTIMCLFSLSMILYHRATEDLPSNCIYLCCGIPLWKINISIVLEMIVWIILSLIPTIAISFSIYHAVLVPMWLLIFFAMMITGIALVPVFMVNKKCNLDMFIRERIVF